MRIEKDTTTTYRVKSSRNTFSVHVKTNGDGSFQSMQINEDKPSVTAEPRWVTIIQQENLDVLRQALQFIDGEAHKHRTAQPAQPAPMLSDDPGTFPTTATPTRSGENADGSSR